MPIAPARSGVMPRVPHRETPDVLALGLPSLIRPWLPGTLPSTRRPWIQGSWPASHSLTWPGDAVLGYGLACR